MGMAEIGIVGTAGTSAVRMAKIGIVGTAKTGAEGMAKTSAAGAAREVAVGIAVSVATSGSSKVSAIRRIDIQNEWRLHQEVVQIHIKGRRKKKAMIKGEEKI